MVGLPFSHFLEYVPPDYKIPVRAVVVSTIVTSLLSLINIGKYFTTHAFVYPDTCAILSKRKLS